MRGRFHCRSHLDPVLVPRGAGAITGNLNAYKTGAHINPLSKTQIKRLAHQLAENPDHFQPAITQLIDDLYRRGRPLRDRARSHADKEVIVPQNIKTLLALQAVLKHLTEYLAINLFTPELDQLISRFPPAEQPELQSILWRILLPLPPVERLLAIRKVNSQLKRMPKGQNNYRDHLNLSS
jgi:hypothetical protein